MEIETSIIIAICTAVGTVISIIALLSKQFDKVAKRFEKTDAEMKEIRSEMKAGFDKVDQRFEKVDSEMKELRKEIGEVKTSLTKEIGEVKADVSLIKFVLNAWGLPTQKKEEEKEN